MLFGCQNDSDESEEVKLSDEFLDEKILPLVEQLILDIPITIPVKIEKEKK